MARKNGRNGNDSRRSRARASREDAVREYAPLIRFASAIVLLAAGVLLGLAMFGAAGPAGGTIFTLAYGIVGVGAFVLPLALILVGIFSGIRLPGVDPI